MSKNGANKTAAWLASVAALGTLAAPLTCEAKAVALFESKEHSLTITLHDDACAMKDQITNLPKKAVWNQDGKVFEGCWGTSAQFGMIFLYFSDKTATGIPIPFFELITET